MLLVTPASVAAAEPPEALACAEVSQINRDAEAGNPQAQATLAKLYRGGLCGLSKDDGNAAKWARLASGKGNASGEALLAFLLNRGLGVTRDDVEAVKWARLSAQQGYIPGVYYLAVLLHHGWGAPRDDAEAIKWARLAAEHGNLPAAGFLALMLYENSNTPKDDIETVKWARRAGEHGDGGAQFVLGRMFLKGRGGLPRDLIEGDMWHILAERSGDGGTSTELAQKHVEALMSKEEIAEAHRRADAWKPKPEVGALQE